MRNSGIIKLLLRQSIIVLSLFLYVTGAPAQDPKTTQTPPETVSEPEGEVLRVSTELVQTGIAVFDKKGQFVDTLRQEDFELRVDGKPVPISFFERLSAGSDASKKQQKKEVNTAINQTTAAGPGRTFIFVVDDLHLSFDSHKRAKDLIHKFIDRNLTADDMVAIVSPSGKIGFLQQFTNDRKVLRAAVERLKFTRDRSATDGFEPKMSEYEAQLIDRYDPEVTDIFAQYILKETPGTDIDSARNIVRQRARTVLSQTAIITKNTLSTLEQAVRRSAPMPGRKVVFFISDGFLLDQINTDSAYRLRRITDAAARANAVIYSFDAKGLEAGFPEGTTNSFRVQSGERLEVQDGLSVLADETGGRFTRNTNDMESGLTKALAETSVYYLLAWQPAEENSGAESFRRIEVSVKGRPDLQIRLQTGYLSQKSKPANEQGKNDQPKIQAPENQLRDAVYALTPKDALPISLTVNYLDMPNEGALLATALQIKSDAVEFIKTADKAAASVELVGVVFNSEGKQEGYFKDKLGADLPASSFNNSERPDIFYNQRIRHLKPGLYQIRVAARDSKSGRVGSAVQWILIPDLSSRKLALSSLLIGEQISRTKKEKTTIASESVLADVELSVDRRFSRSSRLRYVFFIYNAARAKKGAAVPDVTVETKILRGKDILLTNPARQFTVAGQDAARLPYAAEMSLNWLPAGRYELEVTVQDRNAKTTVTERAGFVVR